MALVNTKMVPGAGCGTKKISPETWKHGEMKQKNMHPCGDPTKWIYKYTEIQN